MNPLALMLCCGVAAICGEPSCGCERPDALELGPLSSRADLHVWWTRRMKQRDPRAVRAMRDLVGDRRRAYSAIARWAHDRGRTFLHRKIGRVPLWWQWSTMLAAAINGERMADLIAHRGGLCREWP